MEGQQAGGDGGGDSAGRGRGAGAAEEREGAQRGQPLLWVFTWWTLPSSPCSCAPGPLTPAHQRREKSCVLSQRSVSDSLPQTPREEGFFFENGAFPQHSLDRPPWVAPPHLNLRRLTVPESKALAQIPHQVRDEWGVLRAAGGDPGSPRASPGSLPAGRWAGAWLQCQRWTPGGSRRPALGLRA